jgi:predicted enzyme related to lactoylglutathione lyase
MTDVAARFCRYELRTMDVDAAYAFYRRLLGPDFWTDALSVLPLPEQAVALGAVPHWLGHLSVENVAATAQRFISRGAIILGPPPHAAGVPCILRDPFGAVLALTPAPCRAARNGCVPWHMLHVRNETDAFAMYAQLLGWIAVGSRASEEEGWREQPFSWNETTAPAGSVADTATLPGIHPHWMFFFRTETLEESRATVRHLGGLALPVIERADGSRVAACEDPQRAAFGLYHMPKR